MAVSERCLGVDHVNRKRTGKDNVRVGGLADDVGRGAGEEPGLKTRPLDRCDRYCGQYERDGVKDAASDTH